MEQELTTDANNVTVDTFTRACNAHRENSRTIFTSEDIDKLDELVDAVNKLKINDAKYYELDTATVSNAHGDLSRNLETINHTCNVKFEQKYV